MTDTFRRRRESALTLATFLASAWRCGSVAPGAFRAGLVLLTAALLLILTACSGLFHCPRHNESRNHGTRGSRRGVKHQRRAT